MNQLWQDAAALAEYRGMVFRFLLFLTQDQEAAEDLTQETFRVAVMKGTNPERGANYGAWLRTIARNVLRNYRRRPSARWLVVSDAVVDQAEAHFVASGAERDELWEARLVVLQACLEKLLTADRKLVESRYQLGKKVKELALEMKLEANTLSKRLERIRADLLGCITTTLRRNVHE